MLVIEVKGLICYNPYSETKRDHPKIGEACGCLWTPSAASVECTMECSGSKCDL